MTLGENSNKSVSEILNRWVNETADAIMGGQNNLLFSMKRNDHPPIRDKVNLDYFGLVLVALTYIFIHLGASSSSGNQVRQ